MSDEKDETITAEQREALRTIGRKGGRANAKKYGREHYQRIGAMGGRKVAETRGREFYEEIGRKGGARVRAIMAAGRAAMGNGGDGEG